MEKFDINRHVPVSVYKLKSGMEINYSIFRRFESDYVLLCKNVTLTQTLIEKFFRLTSPDFIVYIPTEHVREVQDDPVVRELKKVYAGYNEVKSSFSGLLDVVSSDEKVPKEVTDSIAGTINTQLETVEVSKIMDSINSVRAIDEYLHTHCVNVALLNGLLGRWMKYSAKDLNTLIEIGLLHDIGKLKIPKEILDKPGKLTEEEFNVIKKHPVFSCEILVKSGVNDGHILKGVLQHHEKMNGRGYPHGLSMEEITDFARITAVSDVYDAMVAKRVYKDAHSPFEILSWFSEGRYSELDINFVNVFLDAMAMELTGKSVLLSNGEVAKVVYVDKSKLGYPLVQTANKTLPTSSALRCVSLVDQ